MDTQIAENIATIKQRIAIAAARCGRDPHAIKLLAVTKTVAPERISQAIDAGITMLGENYVQEAKDKIVAITKPVEWHMIGHLQTNKAKYAVHLFDYVHSVDRWELAKELDKRAGIANHHINILIEVNVSGEQTKNGIPAAGALSLIKQIAPLPRLTIRGLMTMAPYSDNPENSRPYFTALRKLKNEVTAQSISRVQMEELSMGMTDDFAIAIEEGATIVRIGRAIFGERRTEG
jgi:PLP dependent protein